jgi:rhodanese-related sulfurtransferase
LLEGAVRCRETIIAAELKSLLAAGSVQVADLDSSLRYREGHIPGAWHVVRSRLAEQLKKIPATQLLVFTATEEALAAMTATDAVHLVTTPIKVLAGGTAAWRAAGFAVETGDARMTGAADDLSYRALDRKDNVEGAMREYLRWEVELVHAVANDADFRFRRFS